MERSSFSSTIAFLRARVVVLHGSWAVQVVRPTPTGVGLTTASPIFGSALVLLFAHFLTIPLPGERLFDTLFFARLQIEGVALDLFDDVFGLYLALEAAQGILERFPFLYSNLCQLKYTSLSRRKGYLFRITQQTHRRHG